MSDNSKKEKMHDYEIALTQIRAEIQARHDALAIGSIETRKDLRATHEDRAMSEITRVARAIAERALVSSRHPWPAPDHPDWIDLACAAIDAMAIRHRPGEIERLRARVTVLETALRPPEELVGALHDRIHPTSGRLIHSSPIAPPTQEAKP